MNQEILINNGIVPILFDTLNHENQPSEVRQLSLTGAGRSRRASQAGRRFQPQVTLRAAGLGRSLPAPFASCGRSPWRTPMCKKSFSTG